MGWDKHDALVRQLRKHGFVRHSHARCDGTITMEPSDGCKNIDSTIAHSLGCDKYDTIMRCL